MDQFSPEEYQRSVTDYAHTWGVTDQTLYDLCRHHPGHFKPEDVYAKLWLIGRTYATGIERRVPTDGRQGGSMSQVAQLFLSYGAEIDTWFKDLAEIREPLTAEKLKTIVFLHGKMVKLLSSITRNGQSTRSFVSKYMHFHCPAVPIFDSVAYSTMQKLVRWEKSLKVFDVPTDADREYAWYVMQFWRLYQQAKVAGVDLTVKHLDYFLLCVAERLTSTAGG